MNRKIKFRGKRLTTGEWIYGSLLQQKVNGIHTELIMVDRGFGVDKQQIKSGTAGQFTGLCDKSGTEIYEDDILLVDKFTAVVKWNPTVVAFCVQFEFETNLGVLPLGEWITDRPGVSVIGSLHDNKTKR